MIKKQLLVALIGMLIFGLSGFVMASGHKYECACVPKDRNTPCSCDQGDITGPSANPLKVGPMAAPEIGAACSGKAASGGGFLYADDFHFEKSSGSITCDVQTSGYCLLGNDVCRICTNWSFHHHYITMTSIICKES